MLVHLSPEYPMEHEQILVATHDCFISTGSIQNLKRKGKLICQIIQSYKAFLYSLQAFNVSSYVAHKHFHYQSLTRGLRGLMGNYNLRPDDDLVPQSGSISISVDSM